MHLLRHSNHNLLRWLKLKAVQLPIHLNRIRLIQIMLLSQAIRIRLVFKSNAISKAAEIVAMLGEILKWNEELLTSTDYAHVARVTLARVATKQIFRTLSLV